jgi:hypothetical protein
LEESLKGTSGSL